MEVKADDAGLSSIDDSAKTLRLEEIYTSYEQSLSEHTRLTGLLLKSPYSLALHTQLSQCYFHLQYPDLAAGAAYKALLLVDAISDESDEFHVEAVQAMQLWLFKALQVSERQAYSFDEPENRASSSVESVLERHYTPRIYRLLVQGLLMVGCYKSAISFCSQAGKISTEFEWLPKLRQDIRMAVAQHYQIPVEALDSSEHANASAWPDTGFVRRERYPWNQYEPDRFAELETVNDMMSSVAPKLEVLAVELPDLTGSALGISKQLGVFAREDINPGEVFLEETSMLTANNKLQDALCDACSADLPELSAAEASTTVSCPDCEVVFCSQECYELAVDSYHPALCEADVDNIAKGVRPAQAADSLYSLLLLRSLAMAETQEHHPLDLQEVKYIWADFHSLPPPSNWQPSDLSDPVPTTLPRTLPFSFEYNIRLPLHMLEKMDVDIFTSPHAEVWVFNTLYAKFRGTASARLLGLGGRAIRGPEVSAVHPMWCLANHSCDPNAGWEWGGSIRFWARKEMVRWTRGGEGGDGKVSTAAGIRKGEEVLNHYCDVDLPVQERREWARGALGGDCRCERCNWEAEEA